MQIIPMCDLKNTDIDFYENTIHEIYEAKAILEGLKDAEEGRTIDGDQAISTLRSAHEL